MPTAATFRFEPLSSESVLADTEYVLSEKMPRAGDVLKRNGDNWTVVDVKEEADGTSTVILRPGLKPAGS